MKDVQSLKQSCELVTRLQKERERAEQEIETLEKRLANTGSTKSVDEVQQAMDVLSSSMYAHYFSFSVLSHLVSM
jgi:phage shock protein A